MQLRRGRRRGDLSGDEFLPEDLVLDGGGNLYIADAGNSRIRKVDQNGIITTIAGTGSAGFSGDGGAATSAELNNPIGVGLDAAGNLYISGIRRIERVRKSHLDLKRRDD